MSLADVCGPAGVGFLLVGGMFVGGTPWPVFGWICVAFGFLLIALSR